ncbi:MAG: hypothetical protein U9O96_00140 [Candidatus Thermoplasmatota archaeon]|nr:hypothetical protein [Candidatus Thermoplasmatota archaeon]
MGKRNEEKDKITDLVKNYFEEKKKSLCIEEFCLQTGEKTYKRTDLVIIPKWKREFFPIKWEDDTPFFDMIAIESKYLENTEQSIIDAIPQAIVYQQFFPKVCIACPSGDFGSTEKFLKKMGLDVFL